MTTQQYIDIISQRLQLGSATEHTFRGDLQQFIESLVPEIKAANYHLSKEKKINLEIVKYIEKHLGLIFVPQKEEDTNICFANSAEVRDDYKNTFSLIDILNYSFGILYSPRYREKQKEFFKTAFSQLPYPKNTETFWQLVKLGEEICQIHLLASPKTEE